MSSQINESLPPASLKSHWDLIDASRSAMAKEIKSLADSLSGPRATQLRSVSRWLKGSGGYEALLERPDVLCFCQPWVDAILDKPDREPLTEFEMTAAVGVGFCKFENNSPLPRDLTSLLYSGILSLVWLVMITLTSIYLLPFFREIFEEWGIEVPLMTRWVLAVGLWFETNWFPLFAVVLLVPLVTLISLWLSQLGQAYSLNWLDRQFSSFRIKLAAWSTHFARLLSAGIDETEAIEIAGRCSSSKILQARCEVYVEDKSESLLHPEEYPLVSNSLLLTDKVAKIRILEEIAWYYQAVNRIVQGWWLAWLNKSILVLIVGTVAIVAVSLIGPLKAIISGLFW